MKLKIYKENMILTEDELSLLKQTTTKIVDGCVENNEEVTTSIISERILEVVEGKIDEDRLVTFLFCNYVGLYVRALNSFESIDRSLEEDLRKREGFI